MSTQELEDAIANIKEGVIMVAEVVKLTAPKIAESYKSLLDALIDEGFTRQEAMQLVTGYTGRQNL